MAEQDTERTSVRTYVPVYQKEEWAENAEALDMSLSEYVRSMVQAGKRGFGGTGEATESNDREEPGIADATRVGEGLEHVILEILDEGPHEFDELVDAIQDDLRRDADAVLTELEERDRVEHDRLDGGYRVTDDG